MLSEKEQASSWLDPCGCVLTSTRAVSLEGGRLYAQADESDYNMYVMIDPTCETNMTAGGCKQRRCDKVKTPNAKVCTGAAPCTLGECEIKCANSSKANTGGAVESCDYFAYDETDKDCYVFEGCANEDFSDDYFLYTLPYPTKLKLKLALGATAGCSKTRAQGGCTKRRCDKDLNVKNKVCDKDDAKPGGSCSMDQCELKCKDHTAFKCTHWAHDAKDNECYLFATCLVNPQKILIPEP